MGRGEGCWGCLQLLPLDSEAHSIQFPPATGPRTLSLTLCPWASPSCAFDPLSVSNCLPLSPGLLVPACPRLIPSQANGAGETPLRVLGTPEPLLRLQRTWGVWQIPELDAQDAKALLELWPPGSFLVIGHDPRQVLVLRTGPSPGEINTYQILKLPGGVSLESSNLCMSDLPHLLAFLSASRDVLPRTLLLPPPTLGPGDQNTDPLQICSIQLNTSGRVFFVVNKLYLETHREWEMEQTPPETTPETAERHGPAPRNPAPHQVSWVEGPLSPEVHHPRPALASLVEEKKEDDYKDEEEGAEDALTRHIRALARARSSYVARQFRGFRVRLTSEAEGPHRPGDPATELLQDMRHLLADLQDHLAKDPDVRAVFESRAPGAPQKDEDLGPAVEAALCRAVLAPLKPALWTRLRTLRAPALRQLRRRQIALRAEAGPPGAQGAGHERRGPVPALRSRIHARLARLHSACAPRRKVSLLLAVCSDVYEGLARDENQEPLGADAFLPALTEELIWSPNIGETQLDVEFLMELLDPDELRGEAGYYLTTWFGALYHIAHYQPDTGRAPQGLSSEARASLRQWHRRRTLHRQSPTEAQAKLPFEEPWAIEIVQEASDD
ncbi:ras and Rab interactor-like protein isoform X1 [Neophocaena asiaeorientalis asiaeorientalis]|uniref:Ras and Rab interactor-like protein isoform X1 n=2 Tax=Neophocaena asiaeorientalis asiaeorientalis TaxID=1706337 RepID=A0A341DB98_NEOAA|nr:ras and Rab interactor-like protein isoform X1 [Neophocaena asiaeorientalis asiaeorientalis]XP_024624149.1 ras and Rab interactor-like protein isoform X1 [Neophocaena asiaeorientalis asiaeorientalis]